ncbi:hypothetical protein BX600DRAFT_77663 [Xylariales sp. PMI_506]|nr:hypothetical protein BX600DRAFT_77663 [Xylariales sp. PMI_506]
MVKASLPSARITLPYPLYACDFDPHDANHLFVGGGGGPGRHGVGNTITLLDVSKPAEIENAGEIVLSANEDSVQSLAVGPRKDRTTTVFAGINGSAEDAKNGKNPHFRVFGVAQPAKSAKSSGVKFTETARESLFAYRDADTYQRRIRLSQPLEGASQLGVVATGLSKEPQIAVFDVPASGAARWKLRGRLDLPDEAMDLDVVQTGPDTYQLAYCDKHEIFTVQVSKSEVSEPRTIFTIPIEDDDPASRPAFKSLRYLSSGFLFAVVNKANRKGAVLHGYRLPSQENDKARLAVVKNLPTSVTQTTGLAIRNLSPTSSPTEKQGESQFVIAVSGQDASISLFTMDYKIVQNVDILTNLAPFHTIKSDHSFGITGLTFSPFSPPKSSKSASDLSIKLASVSAGNQALVHSIPLKKFSDKSAPPRKGGPPRVTRYVVAIPSKGDSPLAIITVTALAVLMMALIGQIFMEAKGINPPLLGTNRYLPASWTIPLRKIGPFLGPQAFENLIAGHSPEEHERIVIRHDDTELGGVQANIHDEELHGPAKSWDELDHQQRHLWKQRLQKTGHWAENLGETVFKGVLFGEIGGAIGAIVGEAL